MWEFGVKFFCEESSINLKRNCSRLSLQWHSILNRKTLPKTIQLSNDRISILQNLKDIYIKGERYEN
jgi:hypothetical protein